MSQLRPVFVLGPPGATRDEAVRALPEGVDPRTFDRVDSLLEALPAPEKEAPGEVGPVGTVVVTSDTQAGQRLELLRGLASRPDGWVPLLVEPGEATLQARPVSLGPVGELSELVARAVDPRADAPVLELRWVLQLVARARHDINNPLTAGLAEAQLLLMDLEEPEFRESVERLVDQFNRIKDLVAELRSLKQARPS